MSRDRGQDSRSWLVLQRSVENESVEKHSATYVSDRLCRDPAAAHTLIDGALGAAEVGARFSGGEPTLCWFAFAGVALLMDDLADEGTQLLAGLGREGVEEAQPAPSSSSSEYT